MYASFNYSAQTSNLTMPVMLVGGSDMFRSVSVVEFHQPLGGGLRDAGLQQRFAEPRDPC
jgi:hypothetical protein